MLLFRSFIFSVLILAGTILNAQDLHSLIGKNLESSEVKEFINTNSIKIYYDDGGEFVGKLLRSKENGVWVGCTANSFIRVIQLLSKSEGYTPYKGKLPYYLDFSDNIIEVKSKIGTPDRQRISEISSTVSWSHLGLTIIYSTEELKKGIDRIVCVSISEKK
jgi:hypothetical protein